MMNTYFENIKLFLKKVIRFVIKHPFKTFFIGFLSATSFVLILFLFTYLGFFGRIPNKNELAKLKNPITSTIYGTDQKPLGYYFLQNRSNIDSTELNPYLVKALISTEDVRFYKHAGIDYKSYGRVFIKSILLQQSKGGGSTITQQIAKNIYGRNQYLLLSTPINKIREVIIAKRLEATYTKQELLLLYFNTVSFGENLYGIEKASQRFFSKNPSKLTLAESAALIGVLKAPSFYNPRNNPNNAEKRKAIVLAQMLKYNEITEEELKKSLGPVVLKYNPPAKNSSYSGYYKEFIKKEFTVWAEENPQEDGQIYELEKDGLHVYTTLNPNIQKYSENAMKRNIERLQNLMNLYWESNTTEGGRKALEKSILYQIPSVKQLKAEGKSDEEIEKFLSKSKSRKYWEIGEGYVDKNQSLKDSILSTLLRLQTGIIALNSKSGAIMGYLGGIDYGYSQIDNILTPKQVGSTFKPITFLTALEKGIDACDFFDNKLTTYSKYENWTPRNSNNKYGGSYSVHGALANSVNTISVNLQLKTGTEAVIKKAKEMGITSKIPNVPSIVLGTADISLLEMVSAYASIANDGVRMNPYIIQKITDADGKVLFEAKPKYVSTISSKENTKELQKMMREVITDGTGTGFLNYNIPFNIIGKTGTTQNNGDGWFIGSSPEITIGAWVGTIDKRVHFKTTALGSGAATAMPMVASMFKSLSLWKNPLLTNFEYENPYFNCPIQSDFTAEESNTYFKTDSTYLNFLKVRDSLSKILSLPIDTLTVDSLKVKDVNPIKKDSIIQQ